MVLSQQELEAVRRSMIRREVRASAVKVVCKVSAAVAYVYAHPVSGKPVALYFAPKAKKAAGHFCYPKPEARVAAVKEFFARHIAHKERVAAARVARSAPHKLEVGHVLVSSWGYEQTNIDFYQVVRVVGKNTVAIRELKQVSASDGSEEWACGKVVPALDNFAGEEKIHRVNGDCVKLSSFAYAYVWDGRPRWYSSYA